MYKVTEETLKKAYKPFDIVTDINGNVGFIQETSINDSQYDPEYQVRYSIEWIVGKNEKNAWFHHEELTYHGNIFVKIAECCAHPMGDGKEWVSKLFQNWT